MQFVKKLIIIFFLYIFSSCAMAQVSNTQPNQITAPNSVSNSFDDLLVNKVKTYVKETTSEWDAHNSKTVTVTKTTTTVYNSEDKTDDSSDFSLTTVITIGLMFIVLSIIIYFLPTIIALIRKNNNSLAIFALNLLLGWTFIGWAFALIWACMSNLQRLDL